MKIVVPIPVFGRLPLLELTIQRLYNVNGVHKVICVGHEPQAKALCESFGAEWIHHDNKPLGAKWNAGFAACEKYEPDAVLFCGSSDWIGEDYLPKVFPLLQHNDVVGSYGCYFADKSDGSVHAVWWPGYNRSVRNETIGIGRLISAKAMKRIKWQPFNPALDNSMDRSMTDKLVACGAKFHNLTHANLCSISSDKWPNKHKFQDHRPGGPLAGQPITPQNICELFPELNYLP